MSKVQIITDSEEFKLEIQSQLEDFKDQLLKEIKEAMHLQKPEEYLTRKDVAEMLNVHVATIDEWTNKGKLKSYRVHGRRAIYKRSDVEASLVLIE